MTEFGVYKNVIYNNTMSIKSALINTLGEHVDITVPITKANAEKRTIIGIATADAVDHAGDVVTWAASKKAFATTEAAIREQHDKNKPVGRIVGFEAKSLWDPEAQKVVNVIEVEAYISKTAEDTWTKINEGIIKGFSIGGNVTSSEDRISKDDPTKSYRYITDYTLTELSVVDNPCSPQAKILSIHKALDSDNVIMKGMAVDTETDNVFWNNATQELKVTKDTELSGFENIGWIETSKSLDDEVRSEQLAAVLKAHLDLVKTDEGGVTNMPEQEVTEETVEEVETPTTEVVETPSEEETETVEVEEVAAEETDIKKMLDDLHATITTTIEKTVSQSADEQRTAIVEVQQSFEKAITDFKTFANEQAVLSKKVDELTTQFNSMEKSIDALESDTAIKKSSDLGGSTEIKKNKNSWSGTALSVDDL